MNFKILIAEDEDITRKHLVRALKKEGFEVVGTRNGREALDQLSREYFDVLITDIRMPEMSGIELLERMKECHPNIEVMIITGFGSINSAVEAMRKGAYEYITKPFNLDELLIKVKNLHEMKSLKRENMVLKALGNKNQDVTMVARSQVMREVLDTVERIRDSDCGVFITGERGVGKGLLARMIHATSGRRNLPFLSVNCATFPEELFESGLFGSNRVSACCSDRHGQGMSESPESGTLYLDGIAGMPLLLQKRLLKAIEEGEILSEPEEKPIITNVRLIASSEDDPRALIGEHRFLDALFSKLNMIEIFIPPLRDRKEDIEPLCNFFLKKFRDRMQKKIAGFSKEALDLLNNYSFPGNTKELGNIVERAVLIESSSSISSQSLPWGMNMYHGEIFEPGSIKTIEELAREYADRVYRMVEGDRIRAAELLGISENELLRLVKDR